MGAKKQKVCCSLKVEIFKLANAGQRLSATFKGIIKNLKTFSNELCHWDLEKINHFIKEIFWWPTMRKDIHYFL